MNSRTIIDQFLNAKTIAVAGASRNPKKFGNIVCKTLSEKGYQLIPVNPKAESINGIPCVHSISELPAGVGNLLVVTNKNKSRDVVQEAIQKGLKNIWIQNGCETTEAIELAEKNQVNLTSKACIIMYADPKGFHKFHQRIARFFGQYIPEKLTPADH